jgi:hypothetical protein
MRPLTLILTLVFLCFISIASFSQGGVLPEKASVDVTKSITLYPNPTVDFINIKLASLNAGKVKLTLYNILGNEVPAETEVVDNHELRVRVKEFSTGYYLIAVRDEETQFRGTYKFLKR